MEQGNGRCAESAERIKEMKTFKIQVRITEKMNTVLQEACEEYGISISEFIRQLIMKYLVGEINLY